MTVLYIVEYRHKHIQLSIPVTPAGPQYSLLTAWLGGFIRVAAVNFMKCWKTLFNSTGYTGS